MRKSGQLKTFESRNGQIYIESDNDHTFKTAQFISGDYRVRFRRNPDSLADEEVRDWYAYGDVNEIQPDVNETYSHVAEESTTMRVDLREFSLNRSISSLKIQPQATYNYQECRPSDQADLLPYLTDQTVRKNVNIAKQKAIALDDDDFQNMMSTGGPAEVYNSRDFEYQYMCDEQQNFFISNNLYTDADEDEAINNVAQNNVFTRMVYKYEVGLHDAFRPVETLDPESDGLYGLPFQSGGYDEYGDFEDKAQDKDGTWNYFLGLTNWLLRINMAYFAQASNYTEDEFPFLEDEYFEFEFPENSKLKLTFDASGRAVTENASYLRDDDWDVMEDNRIADTKNFHVFRIFDSSKFPHAPFTPEIVNPPAEGEDETAYLAYQTEFAEYQADVISWNNTKLFGDLFTPGTLEERNKSLEHLQHDAFPIDEAINSLYLYLPKRRFARGRIYPQPYSLVNRLITPNRITNYFEKQEATIEWAVKHVHWLGQRPVQTFPNIQYNLTKLVDETKVYGTAKQLLNVVNGNADVRNWDVQNHGLLIEGDMQQILAAIYVDLNIPDTTIYSFVVKYGGRVYRSLDGGNHIFLAAEIVFEQDARYELIVFKKSHLQIFNFGGTPHMVLDYRAWKVPLDGRLLYNSDYLIGIMGNVNNALAGNNLVVPTFVTPPENSVGKQFNSAYNSNGINDADPTDNRPSTDFDIFNRHPDLILPFSVADQYYSWTPENEEYYSPAPGIYHLPHPTLPSAEDIEAMKAPAVDTRIRDEVNKATTGTILFFGDVSDFYRKPETPIVRTEPTTVIANVREPLLGFYGMSQFLPSNIYPVLSDFPPFMQTFKYNMQRKETQNCVITSNESHITTLVPVGDVKLYLESYNTFDQKDKELASVNLPWPEIESFEKVFKYMSSPLTIKCQTIRGKPDYVFVILEHAYNKEGDCIGRNPKITLLKMEVYGEDLTCISKLDENSLYHLTRRNSHIHADTAKNYDELGAVLLTKNDCMDFQQWRGYEGVDIFPLDVTVMDFEEPTDENGNDMGVDDLDMRLRVLFIYPDYSLEGKLHEAKFGFK